MEIKIHGGSPERGKVEVVIEVARLIVFFKKLDIYLHILTYINNFQKTKHNFEDIRFEKLSLAIIK